MGGTAGLAVRHRCFLNHMALPVKIGGRLNLQFGCMQVTIYLAITFQHQEFFYLDGSRNFAHDIRLLATDIAFYHTVRADDDFRSTDNITDQGPVYPQVSVTGNIAFERSSAANETGTA